MPVWQNTAFWSACRISRFLVCILLKISRNTAMQTFALVTVLPFNSTGCGILPTFGGSPPFSGAKVPQPVLLNDLHIIKAVQNRVYSCLQLLPASTRFCFPSIPVGTAWRGITRVRKMQAFPNALRVLPQRHRILGNAAVAVNGLHVHLRHRPY